jgi:hypothetical protein
MVYGKKYCCYKSYYADCYELYLIDGIMEYWNNGILEYWNLTVRVCRRQGSAVSSRNSATAE